MRHYRKSKGTLEKGKQLANVPHPKSTSAESSTPQMTSAGASPSTGQHLSHEVNPHAKLSSRNAMRIGDIPPKITFHPGNVAYDDVHRPPPIQETERPQGTVNSPPWLPSGTQRAIENIVQAHMERLGINTQSQQASQGVWESTAGNVPNPGPKNPQFSFPIFQEGCSIWQPNQLVRSLRRPSGGQRSHLCSQVILPTMSTYGHHW